MHRVVLVADSFERLAPPHRRTGPAQLECRMESACETCSYFSTGPEFVPMLLRQRDHARDRHQPERAQLFDTLIDRATEVSP